MLDYFFSNEICPKALTLVLYLIKHATSHTLKRGPPLVSRSACMTFIPDR